MVSSLSSLPSLLLEGPHGAGQQASTLWARRISCSRGSKALLPSAELDSEREIWPGSWQYYRLVDADQVKVQFFWDHFLYVKIPSRYLVVTGTRAWSVEVTYWDDQERINSAGGVYGGVTYPSKTLIVIRECNHYPLDETGQQLTLGRVWMHCPKVHHHSNQRAVSAGRQMWNVAPSGEGNYTQGARFSHRDEPRAMVETSACIGTWAVLQSEGTGLWEGVNLWFKTFPVISACAKARYLWLGVLKKKELGVSVPGSHRPVTFCWGTLVEFYGTE